MEKEKRKRLIKELIRIQAEFPERERPNFILALIERETLESEVDGIRWARKELRRAKK